MTREKTPSEKYAEYDVVIVGAGVVGSALFYTLSKYTNIGSIALIEKHALPAQVNSHHSKNSQTLHFGDIETNYSYEKAAEVMREAERVAAFVENRRENELFKKSHKMVLAVGDEEIQRLEERHREFKKLFPKLRLLYRDEIAELEPAIVKGRDPEERLAALVTEDGYMINFQRLASCFVEEAKIEAERSGKTIDIFFNEEVVKVTPHMKDGKNDGYLIKTPARLVRAKVASFTAGAHSLLMAKRLGIGREYGVLSVAGNWFCAWHVLKGKVYTLQIPKLPFAAVHGDPTVTDLDATRFGPTAKVLPMLERGQYKTFKDFLETSVFTLAGVLSLFKILADKDIFLFVLKNLAFDIPFLGKYLYLQEIRKIAPSVKYSDLTHMKGGLRPQTVNTKTKKLEMGSARLAGENIIFNITPSPGASVCLGAARTDALDIVKFLGAGSGFDVERFDRDTIRKK